MREALELVRDPIRIGFALLGTVFLMAIFGTGISTDVDNLSFAVLDRDNSHESRTYPGVARFALFHREGNARKRGRS